jgi:hypothetical protein
MLSNKEIENNYEIIRKLTANERGHHGEDESSRCFVLHSAHVTSPFDLFHNKGKQTFEAIEQWKRLNPLLRSHIIAKSSINDNCDPALMNKEYYLAFSKNENNYSIHNNVRLLRYHNSSNTIPTDLWKLVIDYDFKNTPNHTEVYNPWKLTFIQYDTSLANKLEFHYYIILSYHHAIMDGKSSYLTQLELLSIIEQIYTNKFKATKDDCLELRIMPGLEDIFSNRTLESIPTNRTTTEYIRAPKSFDIDNAPKTSYRNFAQLTDDDEKNGCFYDINNDLLPYVTVKSLIELSKNSDTRLATFLIEKDDLDQVLKQCKLHDCKVAPFISVVILKAIRMVSIHLINIPTISY